MSAQVISIKDAGDLSNERVVIKIRASLDIGVYLLLCTKFEDGSVTNEVVNTYWFPDEEIHEGDVVVLYTKGGRDKARQNKSGNKTYFFYWGEKSPLWERSDRAAVLIRSRSWQGFTVDDS